MPCLAVARGHASRHLGEQVKVIDMGQVDLVDGLGLFGWMLLLVTVGVGREKLIQ